MSTLAVILITIVVLSILVIIHEFGHFFAARWAKIPVEEFGLGYPPRAKKLFKWKETLFSLNWVPFGGFVRLEGEDEAAGRFNKSPALKRLIVIIAGAAVNFLFGVVVFSILFSLTGIPTPIDQPRIGYVADNSPAAEVQLQTDTNIVSLQSGDDLLGSPTTSETIEWVNQHRGQTITITTTGVCDGVACPEIANSRQIYLRTEEETPVDEGSMGIAFKSAVLVKYPWYQMPFRGIWYGVIQAFWLGGLILSGLSQIVADLVTGGAAPDGVAGPVGIVDQVVKTGMFDDGLAAIAGFAAMLSINLAIMNLLPIPALDGGRAVFILVEKIVGRRKIERVEEIANYAGYILLLGLIVLISIKDVVTIIK